MDKYAKLRKEPATSDVSLKRMSLPLVVLLLLSMFLTLASTSINAETQTLSSANIKVNHVLEIRNGGLIIINDTVTLSTSTGENVTLQNFSIGFPFQYRSNLDYCFAYETPNPESRFEVVHDIGLGRTGFYGIDVIFPEPVDIRDGGSFNFTVVFVFSDLIYSWVPEVEPWNALFNVSFPMFPSLTQSVSLCNVTIILPSHSTYLGSSHLKEKGLDFNKTVLPTHEILNHVQSPLENFGDELGWLNFVQIEPSADEYFLIFDINQVSRDIRLDEWGNIVASDSYDLTNKAIWNLTEITTKLPKDAYDVYAHDRSGELSVRSEKGNETSYVNASVTLRSELKEGATTEFTVSYSLPWREFINHQSTSNSEFALDFSEHSNMTVRRLVASITLPKGANFRSSSVSPDTVKKNALQETVAFTFYNVTPFHDVSFDLTYEHPIFWASFYPTLWMGIAVAIISIVFLMWRRAPKPPTVSLIPVSPKVLRSFVDAYEEKAKISSELESIEGLLRKGKVTRRRYKIRKKTLEGRLSALSRELANLREEIRVAGPRYANIMGQVEVAEALLEGVETDFRRAEARYRSGEVSKSAYRRLIAEYERRKERAKTTIEGVLIRLREEIR
jgi:hypothetical protein